MTVVALHRWFVVAQCGQWGGADGARSPGSLTHAKEMGTARTACGLNCGTWVKWWERPFPMPSAPTCRTCLEVVVSAPSLAPERFRDA